MMKQLLLGLFLLVQSGLFAQTDLKKQALVSSYNAEAIGDYKLALEKLLTAYDPNDYLINLRAGWLNYLNTDFSRACDYYQIAIKLMPQSVEARLYYAYPLASLKQWDKLDAVYGDILKIAPAHNLALYRRALMHYNLGHYDKAETYLNTLSNLYPADYDIMILKGWTLLKLGKYEAAKAAFITVIHLSPTDASAAEGLKLIK